MGHHIQVHQMRMPDDAQKMFSYKEFCIKLYPINDLMILIPTGSDCGNSLDHQVCPHCVIRAPVPSLGGHDLCPCAGEWF